MTDGWIENDSDIGTEGGEERLKVPLELGIESKLEGALRLMVGSSPLVGSERD